MNYASEIKGFISIDVHISTTSKNTALIKAVFYINNLFSYLMTHTAHCCDVFMMKKGVKIIHCDRF
ncbi:MULTISPECIES: hypothetical protein [Arsenophonus]|uniref:hypothetical protein n=1 Tax=Arsenophonus TaxID=637 RepID=UPI0015D86AE1|nr:MULTISPECIES: hypothetical protein [Arsenophonus]UBX30077.1 hypothetical protein LDL57_05560 [Arsenophonus apicola]